MKKFILIGAFILLHFNTKADDKIIDRFIYKTNYQFQKVKDFQAKMSVRLNVPGLRMPKKSYKSTHVLMADDNILKVQLN